MARQREFDTDTALRGAMDVFWVHGYEGASLPELLKGMGISRGSLYKAFTDKKTLFMTILEHYEVEAVSPAVKLLSDPTIQDGSDRIERLFTLVMDAVRSGDRRGCLLCSTAAGAAFEDAEIANSVDRLLGKMRDGFETALKDSRTHAHLALKERKELADLLITQYVGLRILIRSQASINILDGSISSLNRLLYQKN